MRSNLVRNHGSDNVEFAHNSVRDYLAALRLATKYDSPSLVRLVRGENRAAWEPVLKFSALQDNAEDYAFELIECLASPPQGSETPLVEDVRLACALRRELGVDLPPNLDRFLDDAVIALIGTCDIKELEAPRLVSVEHVELVGLQGPAATRFLGYEPGRSVEVDVACIRTLAGMQTEEAQSAISAYFRDDAPEAVLEALAEAVGYERFSEHRNVLDLPSVRNLVMSPHDARHPSLPHIKDPKPLHTMSEVTVLDLDRTLVRDINFIIEFSSLEWLSLNQTHIKDFTPIGYLKELQTLELDDTAIEDLSPLEGHTGLRTLLLDRTHITDISLLAGLTGLAKLHLGGTQVADLSPLAGLTGLTELHLENTKIEDLSAIAGLKRLRALDLDNAAVANITPLAGLTSLLILDLDDTSVKDLSPLHGLTELRTLFLNGTPVPEEEIEVLNSKLPKCRILRSTRKRAVRG
ncbi:MAG: leucine-rich repeat domain-containing protein [Verrucomicrobiaceae bacterium]|nr:MAG: leucine-rich repeat domain-containing protein [Verrucomicrobiaceae bacterium]